MELAMSKSNKHEFDQLQNRVSSLHVRDTALEPMLTSFKQQVENIILLDYVPYVLLTYGYEKWAGIDFFLKFFNIKIEHLDADDLLRQIQKKLEKKEELEKELKEGYIHHLLETADRRLSQLTTKEPKIGEALRLIRHMTLLLSWTSFECVASDSWEAAVNVRPLMLGHPAFANLPQDGEDIAGLETRSVSVGLLAKHGFDIRGKLGTLLKPKFDFAGVSGIRKAYAAAFGDKLPLDSILGDDNLYGLEVVRHAIVHRAGIADELYLKRTHSTIALGAPIEVDDKMYMAFLRASVNVGCSLLEHIDRYLLANTEQASL
jgi:hypothetical protein